jgi:hypothetical protein
VGKQLTTRTKTGEATFYGYETMITVGFINGVLGKGDISLYLVLKAHLNRQTKLCNPPLRLLVKECHLSKTKLLECRDRLKEMGIIDWTGEKRCYYTFPIQYGTNEQKDFAEKQLTGKVSYGYQTVPAWVPNSTRKGSQEKQDADPDIDKVQAEKAWVPNSTPNHINQKNLTHTEEKSVCESSNPSKEKTTTHTTIPQDILDDIEWVIEDTRKKGKLGTEAGFRKYLTNAYLEGSYEKQKPAPEFQPHYFDFIKFKDDPDAKPLKEFPDVVGGVQ